MRLLGIVLDVLCWLKKTENCWSSEVIWTRFKIEVVVCKSICRSIVCGMDVVKLTVVH